MTGLVFHRVIPGFMIQGGCRRILEGMEEVDQIANTDRDFRDMPLEQQKIKRVVLETFGVEY